MPQPSESDPVACSECHHMTQYRTKPAIFTDRLNTESIAMKPNRSSDVRELSASFSLIRPRRQQRAIGFVPSAVGDQSILSQLWWPITWSSSARQMSLVYWRLSYTTTPCRPLPLILLRRQIGFILNQEYMWIEKLDTHIFYGVVTDKQWNQRNHP